MKTTKHENMQIENFQEWYRALHKQHPEILGAEWDKEAKTLKIFYEEEATELTAEKLNALQIPTVLRFKKKITPPTIPNAISVTAISENEFVVETFNVESVRSDVKKKYPDFEEAKT